MAMTKFKGTLVETCGELPAVGTAAPDFVLTKGDLSDVALEDFRGSAVLLNIFPSIDTSVCATSVRKFNEAAAGVENAKVLCVSRDLPFAQGRFCGAEGIENVVMLSEMRDTNFGEAYGICIAEGPLAGLFARAVVVLDPQGKVAHAQLVPEIAEEPHYDAALAALKGCL